MSDFLGYAHPGYALSLREFGEPRELPRCGGWILVRPIPGTPFKDAMGCYPLFACRDWTRLHEDLEQVGSDLVSLVLVTDPFCGLTQSDLEHCFDLVKPFKTHYVADLNFPTQCIAGKQQRYDARRALREMNVEICTAPARYLDDWMRLYNHLIARHGIKGISTFSRKCFEMQLNLPGMLMLLGRRDEEIIAAQLLLISNDVAYGHLSAFTEKGYEIGASHGIHWTVLGYCGQRGIHYFDVGGTPGIRENPRDGLAKFKAGWSNDRRIVYLCGHIFDREKYDSLPREHRVTDSDFFPAYRGNTSITGSARGQTEIE